MHEHETEMSLDEMRSEHAAELPDRDLLLGISILGLPLLSLDGVTVNLDTSGPGWAISG